MNSLPVSKQQQQQQQQQQSSKTPQQEQEGDINKAKVVQDIDTDLDRSKTVKIPVEFVKLFGTAMSHAFGEDAAPDIPSSERIAIMNQLLPKIFAWTGILPSTTTTTTTGQKEQQDTDSSFDEISRLIDQLGQPKLKEIIKNNTSNNPLSRTDQHKIFSEILIALGCPPHILEEMRKVANAKGASQQQQQQQQQQQSSRAQHQQSKQEEDISKAKVDQYFDNKDVTRLAENPSNFALLFNYAVEKHFGKDGARDISSLQRITIINQLLPKVFAGILPTTTAGQQQQQDTDPSDAGKAEEDKLRQLTNHLKQRNPDHYRELSEVLKRLGCPPHVLAGIGKATEAEGVSQKQKQKQGGGGGRGVKGEISFEYELDGLDGPGLLEQLQSIQGNNDDYDDEDLNAASSKAPIRVPQGPSYEIDEDILIPHSNLFELARISLYDENEKDIDNTEGGGDAENKNNNDGGDYVVPVIEQLFYTIAVFVDPYTQPIHASSGENSQNILSLQAISDLVIALNLKSYGNSNFQLSVDLFKIIERISIVLNAYDETIIPSYGDDHVTNAFVMEHLREFIPLDYFRSDFHLLQLCYSIIAMCFYTIGNLYKNYDISKQNTATKNQFLNPFAKIFLKYWNIHTKLVVTFLEYDRNAEHDKVRCGSRSYPYIIHQVIKGSSTIRNVLAIILNDDYKKRVHDIKHESFLNFSTPWGRKAGNGALTCDMRLYVSAMLSLGVQLIETSALLVDLEPDDKYDEDLLYVFDYELYAGLVPAAASASAASTTTRFSHHDHGNEEDEEEEDEEDEFVDAMSTYEVHPDCHCDFPNPGEDDEDMEEDEEEMEEEGGNMIAKLGQKSKHDHDHEHDDDDDMDRVFYKYVDQMGKEFLFYEKDGDVFDSKSNEKVDLDEIQRQNQVNTMIDPAMMERDLMSMPPAVRGNKDGSAPMTDDNNSQQQAASSSDWRDIPRGDNVKFSRVLKMQKKFFKSWEQFCQLLAALCLFDVESIGVEDKKHKKSATKTKRKGAKDKPQKDKDTENDRDKDNNNKIDPEMVKLILLTLAKSIKDEENDQGNDDDDDDDKITPDKFYQFISAPEIYRPLLSKQPELFFGIIDEMMMCRGYRRVMIWFLTHLDFSNEDIINYIHDLVLQNKRQPMSRMGKLVLSEIEVKMLLHEYFCNCAVFLSRGLTTTTTTKNSDDSDNDSEDDPFGIDEDEEEQEEREILSKYHLAADRQAARALIAKICSFIRVLIDKKLITPSGAGAQTNEYKQELQVLLIQWIVVSKEFEDVYNML